MEVTLEQVLAARETRAARQLALIGQYGLPVVSFSMNIPGPVKDSPLIRRGFRAGCAALDHRLPKGAVRCREIFPADTGWEAAYVVDMPPLELKAVTTAIEDRDGLGRLLDMDVIGPDLQKLDRAAVGGGDRGCIVCGRPGRGCASRRLHPVGELQQAARDILLRHFAREDDRQVGAWAVQSLLDEVCVTPKPGLVDRRNTGSHRDMDIFTFMASAAALGPYFQRCAALGRETADRPPEETFRLLRQAGLRAEEDMLAATAGVNTHKGAIFTIGLLCGAAGRLWRPEAPCWEESALFREVAAMAAGPMEEDLARAGDGTAGQRLYRLSGVRGVRGEAARGLPAVAETGLPVYRGHLARELDRNRAGALTLLALIAAVEDTNLLARGGADLARQAADRAAEVLSRDPDEAALQALDDWFIENNLSPGGCADLLAAVFLADRLTGGGPV